MNREIKFQFIGVDSLGYEHGKLYELVTDDPRHYGAVAIKRKDGTGYCPYESWSSFFENWLVLT